MGGQGTAELVWAAAGGDDAAWRALVDRFTGLPMWSTELTVKTAENGAQVITVTTVGQTAPQVSLGDLVEPVDLEALPWTNTDATGQTRSGVAFKATELRALVPAAG